MSSKLSDSEKIKLINNTLNEFNQIFGEDDIIKQAFFDILLEVVYEEPKRENLPVSCEEKQKDNKVSVDVGNGKMPTYKIK